MDFPKSVPGVGLVGGQFADEDPALGRQGSLIPSAWGNAVTQELLNVIQAAGLEPNEVQTDQLLEAIRTLVPERSAFARVSGTLILPATAFGIYALADGGVAATVTLPSTADLVDDTELLLFANHTNSASMQVKAAAGQTVQGPAALMAGSTTAFMLPAGGDWVRLRSEKAQGRWVVVSAYSAEVAVLRSQLGIAGQAKNLRCSATGTDALVRVTADQIFLDSAGGQTIKLRGVDLTINTATVGANGLDTGALAANTWYSLWVISDGVNVRGLVSLSATAPNLPAGYTSKARVGWIRTDSTASKYPSAFVQRGKYIDWVTPVVVGSGVMGVWSPVAWVELSLSTAIPVTSISVKGFINGGVASVGQGVQAAPNNSFTASQTSTNPAPVDTSMGSAEAIGRGSRMFNFVLQSSSIYGCSNAAAASIRVLGWEDSL